MAPRNNHDKSYLVAIPYQKPPRVHEISHVRVLSKHPFPQCDPIGTRVRERGCTHNKIPWGREETYCPPQGGIAMMSRLPRAWKHPVHSVRSMWIGGTNPGFPQHSHNILTVFPFQCWWYDRYARGKKLSFSCQCGGRGQGQGVNMVLGVIMNNERSARDTLCACTIFRSHI